MFKCRLRTRLLRCSQQAFLFTVNESLSLCGTRLHCVLLLGISSMVTGGERKWLCERSLTLVKVDALVRTTLGSVQLRSRSRLSELNCCLTKGVLKRPGSSIWNLKWRNHTVELRCTIFLRNKLSPFSDLLMRALPVRICIHAMLFLFIFLMAYCRCSLDTVDVRSTQKIALRCYLLEDVCSKIVHLISLIIAAIIHAAWHMRAFEAVVNICNVVRHEQYCFEAWKGYQIAISNHCKLPCEAVENSTSLFASAYWLISAMTIALDQAALESTHMIPFMRTALWPCLLCQSWRVICISHAHYHGQMKREQEI